MTDLIKTSNVPKITIQKFKKRVRKLIGNAVRSGVAVSQLSSVYLEGPMGVGKSQGIRELSSELESETGKRVNLIDIRLLLYSPVDLRGIPAVNADKTACRWLLPDVFKLDDSPEVINIVFLDELSSCTPAVQAAAYQIVLDHRIGEHKLPDNTYIIAAGNRMVDKSVVYKMPKALANRMTHFEIVTSVDEWCDWAVNNNIDHRIIGFIRFKNNLLMMTEETDEMAFPTPRSWAMASRYLDMLNGNIDEAYLFICGCIGSGTANLFTAYCNTYSFLPNIADIFSGKPAKMTKRTPDILHALTSSMIAYARTHRTSYPEIETSLGFADRNLPTEFVAYLLHGYFAIDKTLADTIKTMQTYKNIISKRGSAFNGII